jgi:hypothetical protein
MSMDAIFVQVEDAEIARFEADPDLVEALFANQTLPTAGLLNMTAAMQERLRAIGPEAFGPEAFAERARNCEVRQFWAVCSWAMIRKAFPATGPRGTCVRLKCAS